MTKAWYLPGLALWAIAWIGFTGSAYAASLLSDEEVESLVEIELNAAPAEVQWPGGSMVVFVERGDGQGDGSAPKSVDDLAEQVDVSVSSPEGGEHALRSRRGFQYRGTSSSDADGWSTSLVESLPPGTYQIAASGDEASIGMVQIGEEPSRSLGSMWIWVAVAIASFVWLILVARRRRTRQRRTHVGMG
jgi:hypothetical protein